MLWGGGGKIAGWHFEFICLEIRLQKNFVSSVQILKKKKDVLESQLYYFRFKTKFQSQAKGNPRAARMFLQACSNRNYEKGFKELFLV
jgi:hypothetical protein